MSTRRILAWAAAYAFGGALLGLSLVLAHHADHVKPFPDTIQAWCAHDWQELAGEHCK